MSVNRNLQGGIIDYQCQGWNSISSSVDFTISIDLARIKNCLSSTAKILDYGCGYGRISRLLKDAGYVNIIGYDTAFSMIERGRIEDPDLDLRHNETYQLSESSGCFDAVIVAAVFTSISDDSLRGLVLKEITRVLNKDGVLILSEFLRDDQRQYDINGCFVSKIGIKMKHFSESEIRSMLHGWDIIHFESVNTESIGRSVVPAVNVIAHPPQRVIQGKRQVFSESREEQASKNEGKGSGFCPLHPSSRRLQRNNGERLWDFE